MPICDSMEDRFIATRRRTLGLGGGAVLALALGGCAKSSADVLRVGSQKGGTKALMLAAGVLDGITYRIDWSDFPAAQTLLEALGSGAIDLGLAGDAPFQFAYQSGVPIRAVGAQRAVNIQPGALAVIVAENAPIRSVRDLVGKRVATTHGSIGHYLVLRALAKAGLPLDAAKITFLSPADTRAAMQTGAVDAWSTWAPYTVAAIAEGARIVVDGRDFSNGTSFDVANLEAIETKRAILADFLQREAKALEWAQGNVPAYTKVLSRETGLPPTIALGTAQRNTRLRTPIDDRLIADQQIILDTFQQAGEIKQGRPIKDAFAPIV